MMWRERSFFAVLALGMALGGCDCGGNDGPRGTTDGGGVADGATPDGGPTDGGRRDTGPMCGPEECNGLDDDCDGTVDEDVTQACGTNVGECSAGMQVCEGGTFGMCMGEVPPATEMCNAADDDCDGTVDEELVMNLAGDLRLTTDDAPDDYVAVGWTGTHFGVVWSRGTMGRSLWFRALDAYGMPVTDAVQITSGGDDVAAQLAWNDVAGEFGIVYTRNEEEIRLVRVDPSGSVVGADVVIAPDVSTRSWPWIDWNGTHWAIVWHAWVAADFDLEVFAAIAEPDGTVLQTTRVTEADGESRYPNVRWNGSAWGVVWADARGGTERVWYARLSADGTAEEISDTPISAEGAEGRWPNIDLGPDAFGVTWHGDVAGDNEVFFATVGFDGAVAGEPVQVTTAMGEQEFASVDWTGTQYVVAWQDARGADYDAYFAFVGTDGSIGGEHQVTSSAGQSQFVTAIWTGAHYGVGWRDDRDGNNEIYFTYVGCP